MSEPRDDMDTRDVPLPEVYQQLDAHPTPDDAQFDTPAGLARLVDWMNTPIDNESNLAAEGATARKQELVEEVEKIAESSIQRKAVGERLRSILDEDRQLQHTMVQLEKSHRLAREVRDLAAPTYDSDRRSTSSPRVPHHPIRMAFMLDIVSYGRRNSPAKDSLQQRLANLVQLVLDDLGVALSDTERQGTGDGVLVILPGRLDVQRALPLLLRSTGEQLTRDNAVFQDRMRVRMSADVGPVGVAELGFGGSMVTNIGRLLDSRPLRGWVSEHTEHDLAVILSDSLYRFVVAEGVPELAQTQFARMQVRAKEATTSAWLWTR